MVSEEALTHPAILGDQRPSAAEPHHARPKMKNHRVLNKDSQKLQQIGIPGSDSRSNDE